MDHTFTIYNFGCKVNQEEGGALAARFTAAGWRYVTEDQPAELVIVKLLAVWPEVKRKRSVSVFRRLFAVCFLFRFTARMFMTTSRCFGRVFPANLSWR